jgi:hypothetical protein
MDVAAPGGEIVTMDDRTAPDVSEKSRTTALILNLLTGFVGGHRFFAGKVGTGVLMVCTLGGLGLWWVYDLVLIGTGEFRDADGRRILRWSADDPLPGATRGVDSRLLGELETMHSEVYELQERVDFLERTLAQVRERPRLPG